MLLSIDPGNHGAYALFADKQLVAVDDIPNVNGKINPQLLAEQLSIHAGDIQFAVIEKVGAMPGQGVTSMFNFGAAVGQIKGILAAFSIPYTEVAPRAWKASFGLISATKDASRAKALELFPGFAPQLQRKKDVDRAEAILIGLHYLQKGGDQLGQKEERRRRQEVLSTSQPA